MIENKFTVIRDTREKPEFGWSFAQDAYCDGTIVDKVNAGDYTIQGLDDYILYRAKTFY